MTYIKGFKQFRKIFFKPKVFAFIVTGVGLMFLTFLTRQDALEFGISGIASIFIGIGVNNFTAFEMEQQDERRQHLKSQRTIKTLVHLQEKILSPHD